MKYVWSLHLSATDPETIVAAVAANAYWKKNEWYPPSRSGCCESAKSLVPMKPFPLSVP